MSKPLGMQNSIKGLHKAQDVIGEPAMLYNTRRLRALRTTMKHHILLWSASLAHRRTCR
jgi:hypothetical protein